MTSPTQTECQRTGCRAPRTPFSIFCEQHHHEQLIRFGLASDTPPDPCAHLHKRSRHVIRALNEAAISSDEASGALAHAFVDSGAKGNAACWERSLADLPAGVIAGMLDYLKSQSEPMIYRPLPALQSARGEAERRARAQLIQRLERWVPLSDGEV